MIRPNHIYKCCIALLLCVMQTAGIRMYAQVHSERSERDSVILARTDTISVLPDSLRLKTLDGALVDPNLDEVVISDSIARVNEKNMTEMGEPKSVVVIENDSLPPPITEPSKPIFIPNPTRATWLAVVIPGGGQIYNRKYWKLPIFYGGFAGCAYALSWNNNMFKDYSQAYIDIMDGDPTTNSYYDLLPIGVVIDEATDTRYSSLLKSRKDYYRRYRDISVFAFIGVYVLSIIDAYVDAELSNFDVSPDLSIRIYPTIINNDTKSRVGGRNGAFGLQCSITF